MKKNNLRVSAAILLMASTLLSGCASNRVRGPGDDLPTSSDQTANQKRANIHLQLAIGYFQHHELSVALDEIKRALVDAPNSADAYSVRGLIYMEMGETHLADESFQYALNLAPNNPDMSNNYGWFLCQNGRERESIAYFQAALKNHSYESPQKALNNAGVCTLKLKNVPGAQDYFLQAFRYDPANPVTNLNLAKIYYGQADYKRSQFYIDRVIKSDMVTPEALWLGIRISKKLGDRDTETTLITQLSHRYPASPEYSAFQRGAFNE